MCGISTHIHSYLIIEDYGLEIFKMKLELSIKMLSVVVPYFDLFQNDGLSVIELL